MINGINYSAQNAGVTMFGRPIVGVTKISYSKKQGKENNYSLQNEPTSRGYKSAEYDCSIEMYLDEWKAIQDSAPDNDPTKIPPFEFQVIFSGDSVNYKEDHILFAEFLEDPLAVSAGDTKILITIPVIIGGIQHL